MDILQVSPLSYRAVGGVQEHVRNISERLARKHNVTVYTTDCRPKFPRCEVIKGVNVERFGRFSPNNAYFFSHEMFFKSVKSARDFDVVHAHLYHAFPMHLSALAKCSKFVVTTHFHGRGHSVFRNFLLRLLKPFGKTTLKKADKVIAVSNHEKRLLCQHFGLDPGKIVMIPNGVDLSGFSSLKKTNSASKHVLYVGSLLGYKGVQYLVEVLPRLGDDVVLWLVGEGPLKHSLEKRAKELKVHERIRFFANLPRRELLQKYVDADVVVLLSKYEAYSLVVAEALAAGTPCIVTNASALSEWVDNRSCYGVHFPVNLAELAMVISKVLSGSPDRRAMKKWVGMKVLDWNDVVKRLESVYKLVIHDK